MSVPNSHHTRGTRFSFALPFLRLPCGPHLRRHVSVLVNPRAEAATYIISGGGEGVRECGLYRSVAMPSSSSPAAARNGGELSAAGVGGRKKAAGRRLAGVMLLLRLASLCFAVAAAAFAATDGAALRAAPFRFLLAANAIVAVYSAFEVAAAAWEVAGGATLLPEAMQLWFDFGHDQVRLAAIASSLGVSSSSSSPVASSQSPWN